jgi:hypothetical protein
MEFTKEAKENMIFTNHILERFVERTMNKTGTEMKQYLAQNEDKVKEQILKLYEYSELFWYGKIKNHDFTYFTINRDGWVFVIDKNKTTFITVYKVDLGLSTEFNKQYIQEIKNYVELELEEIFKMKDAYNNNSIDNSETIDTIRENIKTLKTQIALYESQVKLIEDEQKIDADAISLKEKQLQQKIEKFIGAKIFEK